MPSYKFDTPLMGFPPIEQVLSAAPVGSFPTMGSLYPAEDKVFGPGEFVFARANGTIRVYGLCVLTPVWDSTNLVYTMNATEVPNTTLLGRPAYVAQVAMTSGQFGWFQVSGITPVNCTASVAADTAFGIAAAGQGGALAAGKQVLNARVVTPATNTVIKAGTGVSGDNTIYFPSGVDGFFVGGYLSGTGVGAATIITAIDVPNKRVTVSVVNSAAITGNVTQTANNAVIFYNIAMLNRAGYQGPIT